MNTFNYEYPVKNYFGVGAVKANLSTELKKVGQTVILAYGGGSIKKNGIYDEVVEILKEAGKTIVEFSGIMSNSTYDKVLEGAKLAKENDVDFILAVGGGSVSDCCKVVASQAKTEKDIWEMIMTDHTLPVEALPLGVIVTASGTGSEQNAGAVITNTEEKIKAGLFCAIADFAILDPKYTLTVPMKQVISGAFDTLSHAMETYFGKSDTINISDEISEAVMRNVIRNMKVLLTDPENMEARSELMWDSAMAENGILKIGKVTDFQAHQIEHQLGAYTDCNHGQGLAVIHPALYRHIYESGLSRFARFAECVWTVDTEGKSEKEIALAGIDALAAFIKEMGLP
ncbi:MAG: iron-containing alcohol dehydrogenase, partial [Lachnospiraceae bacterium]|nr:iron-containing alcohol dehydrogenase [Lachnospiraceae bacterium]